MRIVAAPHGRSIRLTRFSAAVLIAAALGACAGPAQMPVAELNYKTRAVTHQRESLSVTAVALSAGESRAVFEVPLAAIDVQPVWIEVENQSERPRWFFPISVDPDYFPAGEVAQSGAPLAGHGGRAPRQTERAADQAIHRARRNGVRLRLRA